MLKTSVHVRLLKLSNVVFAQHLDGGGATQKPSEYLKEPTIVRNRVQFYIAHKGLLILKRQTRQSILRNTNLQSITRLMHIVRVTQWEYISILFTVTYFDIF